MSQENIERMKTAFEAFEAGDLETIVGFVDPDFQIHDRVIGSPSGRGLDALVANAAAVREAFGDASWEPREFIDAGDRVLVRVRVTGTGEHTSLPVENDVGTSTRSERARPRASTYSAPGTKPSKPRP